MRERGERQTDRQTDRDRQTHRERESVGGWEVGESQRHENIEKKSEKQM